MLDKETLQALQTSSATVELASVIHSACEKNEPVGIPDNFRLHSLESHSPERFRARGTMETTDLYSFALYVGDRAQEGGSIFVDPAQMTATAVLNLGTRHKPGHADDLAILRARQTAAYQALKQITGQPQSQGKMAEFLEDWADLVSCYDDESSIKTSSAIAAVRKLTIEAMRKVESEDQSLSASKSTFESVSAKSTELIPKLVYFKCVPYMGLAERTFVMRFGIQTGGDKPSILLRIIKSEEHDQEMAEEFCAKVSERFPVEDGFGILIGTYKVRT